MINKEDKYRNELFELFRDDLTTITDDEVVLKLLRDIFLTDIEEIKDAEIIDKLTKHE